MNIVTSDRLMNAARVLHDVRITCGDFAHLFDEPGENVLVFADPPYVRDTELSQSAKLYEKGFTLEDRLAREYKNVAFDKEIVKKDATLDWVTPGHPLFESVRTAAEDAVRKDIERGSVFFDLNNADAMNKVAQIQNGMRGNMSPSQIQSKLRDLSSRQEDASKAQKEQADINKKLADKTRDLYKYKAELAKEEDRERKKLQDADKKRQKEMVDYGRDLERQLREGCGVVLATSFRSVFRA